MFVHSVVGRVTVKLKKKNSTTLGVERSGVRITAGTKFFCSAIHIGIDTHTDSYSIGTAFLSRGNSGRSVKLTTHLPQCQG